MRNSAVEAREGDGKSLPRGERFRVRVTCTKKARGADGLRIGDSPLKFARKFSKL